MLHPTLAVLPQMRARDAGRIVNITSIGGKVSVPHLSPYCAATFAATGFSEGLHAELAREGISVTTIGPGLMRAGSAYNAEFKGDQEREYLWFLPLASLPLFSMDAERAARQIVDAAARRSPERTLSLAATLAARANGLFPGGVARLSGLANRWLPGAPAESGTVPLPGMAVEARIDAPQLRTVSGWTRAAARRFNEFPGPLRAHTSANGASHHRT